MPCKHVIGHSVCLELIINIQTKLFEHLEDLNQHQLLRLSEWSNFHRESSELGAHGTNQLRVGVEFDLQVLLVQVVAEVDVVNLDLAFALLVFEHLNLGVAQVHFQVVEGGDELRGVHVAFAQAVLVFEEQFGADGLVFAVARDFAEHVRQRAAEGARRVDVVCEDYWLEHVGVVGLVGEAEVGEEVPVVDVFIRVFGVALVLGNHEDVFVVDYFEVAESLDQHLGKLPLDDFFPVVQVLILEVVNQLDFAVFAVLSQNSHDVLVQRLRG